MTYKEAAARLGLKACQLHKYAKRLALPRTGRDRMNRPCYDFSEEHLERIRQLREETRDKAHQVRAARCAGRPIGGIEHIQRLARNARVHAIRRQDSDYYGRLVAFDYAPVVCEDPELSSSLPGGPIFATMQWIPFYPDLSGDLDPWAKAGTWNPLSHDSDEWMYDRHALQVWYAHSRS